MLPDRFIAAILLVAYGIPIVVGPSWHHGFHALVGNDSRLNEASQKDTLKPHVALLTSNCCCHDALNQKNSANPRLDQSSFSNARCSHCAIQAFYAQPAFSAALLPSLPISAGLFGQPLSVSSPTETHICPIARGPPCLYDMPQLVS